MKNGKYAVYENKEYTAWKTKDGKIGLRSDDIQDIKKGFEICEPFLFKPENIIVKCLKFVDLSEVKEYYRLHTIALYSGYQFEVIEENDYKISIVCSDYAIYKKLNMVPIDKFEYQKWIYKNEAKIVVEKESLL